MRVVVEFCLLLLDGLLEVRTPALAIREFALELVEVCELGLDFLALTREPPEQIGVDRMHDDRRRTNEFGVCPIDDYDGPGPCSDPQRFVSSHGRYEYGVHYSREYGNVGLAYLPGLYELRVD